MSRIIGALAFAVLVSCARPNAPTSPPTANASHQQSSVFNVKDFGAKGDGVTDDAPAIRAAIAAKDAARGGEVFFPAGNYLCESPIDFGSAGGIIRGVGWATNDASVRSLSRGTFLYSTLANGYAFTVGEGGNNAVLLGIQIKDMAFVSTLTPGATVPTHTAATGLAIRPMQAQATVGVVLQNLFIDGFAVGLSPGSAQSSMFNNISTHYNNTGILIEGSPSDRTFQNNVFQNLNSQGNQIGVDVAVGQNVTVFGGILQANTQIGLRFKPRNPGGNGAGQVAEIAMHGIWFESNNREINGYQVTATGTRPPLVTITGTPPGGVPASIEIDVTKPGPLGASMFRWKLNGAPQENERTTAPTFPLGSTGMTATFPAGAYASDNVYNATARGDIVVDVSNETKTNPMLLLDVAFHNCHSSDGGPLQFVRNAPQHQSTYATVKFYDSTFIGVTLPLPNWSHRSVVLGSTFTAITDPGATADRTLPNVIVGSANFPSWAQQVSQLGAMANPSPRSGAGGPFPGVTESLETSSVETAAIYTSPAIPTGHALTIEALVTSTDAVTQDGYSAKIAGTFYNSSGKVHPQGAPTSLYNHGNIAGLRFVIRGASVVLEVTPNTAHETRHRCDVDVSYN